LLGGRVVNARTGYAQRKRNRPAWCLNIVSRAGGSPSFVVKKVNAPSR
jgi:hypothetical protein